MQHDDQHYYTPQPQPVPAQPTALIVGNRFSIIWLVPICAALAGGWLGWRSVSSQGPEITITFENAEGLEAGRTKIKHKNVDMGTVEKIEPTPDLKHIIVTARMNNIAKPHLTSGARFWVVRPRLSAEGVSGLETLISGSYIEFDPGDGEPAKKFTGEHTPPIITANEPGETYTLHATQLGAISQGSPVFFHGVKVGEVLGYELSDTDGSATVRVFVRAPHNKLVHAGTRFWNTSGITVVAGSAGVKIQLESLQTLITGGITFDVPSNTEAGDIADPDTRFTLYSDQQAAQDATFTRRIQFLLHFAQAVPGLTQGAEVRMQGLGVGEVTDVHIEYDSGTGRLVVPVTIEIEAERIKLFHSTSANDEDTNDDKTSDKDLTPAQFEANTYAAFRELVSHGLRARLGTGNMLTGQKIINLDLVAKASPAALIETGPVPEIPTLDSDDIDSVIRSAGDVLNGLKASVNALNKAFTSPQMTQSLRALNRSLVNLDHITHETSVRVGPLLQSLQDVSSSADSMLKQTDTAIGSGDDGGDLAGTLREFKDAARSARVLTDYLETHPEALIRGKPGDEK